TMRALRDRGLDVPQDVALVGFDDFEWADVFSPRLTTAAQDAEQIGSRAVELLLERIADPDLPPRAVRVPAQVMHRDSCGCGLTRGRHGTEPGRPVAVRARPPTVAGGPPPSPPPPPASAPPTGRTGGALPPP